MLADQSLGGPRLSLNWYVSGAKGENEFRLIERTWKENRACLAFFWTCLHKRREAETQCHYWRAWQSIFHACFLFLLPAHARGVCAISKIMPKVIWRLDKEIFNYISFYKENLLGSIRLHIMQIKWMKMLFTFNMNFINIFGLSSLSGYIKKLRPQMKLF